MHLRSLCESKKTTVDVAAALCAQSVALVTGVGGDQLLVNVGEKTRE